MAKCEVCGNDYELAFEVTAAGKTHVFDSFECAIHQPRAYMQPLQLQNYQARRRGERKILLLRTLRADGRKGQGVSDAGHHRVELVVCWRCEEQDDRAVVAVERARQAYASP